MKEMLERMGDLYRIEESRKGAGDKSLNQVTVCAVCVRESVCGYAPTCIDLEHGVPNSNWCVHVCGDVCSAWRSASSIGAKK